MYTKRERCGETASMNVTVVISGSLMKSWESRGCPGGKQCLCRASRRWWGVTDGSGGLQGWNWQNSPP